MLHRFVKIHPNKGAESCEAMLGNVLASAYKHRLARYSR